MASNNVPFQAVILAAGRGSRMLGMTENQPKCMTMLAGKPLLEWQLEALGTAGAAACTVMTGYLGHMLHGDFATINYPRWQETNMVGTLAWGMRTQADRTCIISYSDIVYRPEHVSDLVRCPHDIAIAYDTFWHDLWSLRFDDPLADAETLSQENGMLRSIGKRAASVGEIEGQYMGLLRITPQGWREIDAYLQSLSQVERDKLDMTGLLGKLLERGVPIGAVPVCGGWCEVDNEHDVAVYEEALARGNWRHDWRQN